MNFDKILVTTDFSGISYSAFELAAHEAKMWGSKVTLCTVVEDWDVPEVYLKQIPDPGSVRRYRQELLETAEHRLSDLVKESFHGQEVEIKAILSKRNPAAEITDLAKTEEFSLIVMASHGRGAFGNLFLGGCVQKVLQHAHCPVVVVPSAKDGKS